MGLLLQTALKLGHKGLQDFVASPEAVILTNERRRACEELMEGSGEEQKARPDPPPSKPAGGGGFIKPGCGMVLRRRGEEDQGPLETLPSVPRKPASSHLSG